MNIGFFSYSYLLIVKFLMQNISVSDCLVRMYKMMELFKLDHQNVSSLIYQHNTRNCQQI